MPSDPTRDPSPDLSRAGLPGAEPAPADADALSCLGPIISDLSSSLELDEVFERLAARCRQTIGYDGFAILLLDELGQQLEFRFAVGFRTEARRCYRLSPTEGAVGQALANREPTLVHHAEDDCPLTDGQRVACELAVPLVVKGRAVGVLDVRSSRPRHFTDQHLVWLGFLAGPLANAIENARLYDSMRRQSRSLTLLHEIGRELTAILDRGRLLRTVAESVRRIIDYDIFHVMLWNPAARELQHALSIRYDERLCEKGGMPLGYGITGTAAALKQPVRVANVDLDPRYVECGHGVPIRSELVIPLTMEDRLIGVLDLESTEYNAFRAEHEQMLSTLGSSVAIALENARLYQKLREEERRLEGDLETARDVQTGLLPPAGFDTPGLEAGFCYLPARELGGDFYDVVPYGEERTAFAIGDVAGKGTAAALFGSMAVGVLRGRAVQHQWQPAEMLTMLNQQLRATGIKDRFVAMAFAVFDGTSRELALASAGFPRPWLVRADGRVESVVVEGPALGVLAEARFRQQVLELAPGDTVVFLSDGFEECMDGALEPFGNPAIAKLLVGHAGAPPARLIERLVAATDAHRGSAESHDDRTAVVLRLPA